MYLDLNPTCGVEDQLKLDIDRSIFEIYFNLIYSEKLRFVKTILVKA